MFLKDSLTLWGISTLHLKEYSKKYKLWVSLLYIADILAVIILTKLMFEYGASFEDYGFILVGTCVVFHFIIFTFFNQEKWEAFKFFRKNENNKVVVKKYDVDEEKLYSVLYCTGYKRLRQNRSLDFYKELILSACCENIKYSKSIMKYLKKYENESGNLTCYIISKRNRDYFIDFVAESNEEDAKEIEGNGIDDDYTGNAEES